jgi:hypothetical protein
MISAFSLNPTYYQIPFKSMSDEFGYDKVSKAFNCEPHTRGWRNEDPELMVGRGRCPAEGVKNKL